MTQNNPRDIRIDDFSYDLPPTRIAVFPKEKRDSSKLLVAKNEIQTDEFRFISKYLPPNSLIVFNNSRVVEARLLFHKPTGAAIEVFCLEPDNRFNGITSALQERKEVYWKCLVGNAASWTSSLVLEKKINDGTLYAKLVSRETDHFLIHLYWTPGNLSFAEVLHEAGAIPLPPYIKRKAEQSDSERYQTVYAHHPGSVAAPTAGLHFTDDVLSSLAEMNIQKQFVTLHVGAGTFKPVKTETLGDHEMHGEYIEVSRSLLEQLINNDGRNVIAVGTTSLRTLESIYWLGVEMISQSRITEIMQWTPYEKTSEIPAREAITALLNYLEQNQLDVLFARTSLIIVPGYRFRIVDTLITNFHQPKSTLLLLIAAFIGEKWKSVYAYALENDFRFLSYGDSCLLFRQ